MTIRYRDSTEDVVKVMMLDYLHAIPRYALALGKNVEEIKVLTNKDQAWAESLSDDSVEAIIDEGRRLNFPRSARYLKRQMDLAGQTQNSKLLDRAIDNLTDKLLAEQRPK